MPLLLASRWFSSVAAELTLAPKGARVAVILGAADELADREAIEADTTRQCEALGWKPEPIRLSDGGAAEALLLAAPEVVVVGGGDPFRLLALLRQTEVGTPLAWSVPAGLAYVGISAGAIVAGPSLAPATVVGPFEPRAGQDLTGLALVDHVVLPHADRPERAERHRQARLAHGDDLGLVELGDTECLLYDDDGVTVEDAEALWED